MVIQDLTEVCSQSGVRAISTTLFPSQFFLIGIFKIYF